MMHHPCGLVRIRSLSPRHHQHHIDVHPELVQWGISWLEEEEEARCSLDCLGSLPQHASPTSRCMRQLNGVGRVRRISPPPGGLAVKQAKVLGWNVVRRLPSLTLPCPETLLRNSRTAHKSAAVVRPPRCWVRHHQCLQGSALGADRRRLFRALAPTVVLGAVVAAAQPCLGAHHKKARPPSCSQHPEDQRRAKTLATVSRRQPYRRSH